MFVLNSIVYPIYVITTKPPMLFNKDINNYTPEGREKIHKKVGYIDRELLKYYSNHPMQNKSVEYNDNRLSLYVAQKGLSPISKIKLDVRSEVHHIKPIKLGGNDEYKNLIMLDCLIHKLIHVKDKTLINLYVNVLRLNKKAIDKINKFRINVGNECISW